MGKVMIRISIVTVALGLLLVSVIGCGGKSDISPAQEMMQRAQKLQEEQNFDQAIKAYKKIVDQFPQTREGANSQFMIGFLYGNYLNDQDNAKIELQKFIDNFSELADSGLVKGAEFELKYMGKSIDEIPILSGLGDKGDTAAPVVADSSTH